MFSRGGAPGSGAPSTPAAEENQPVLGFFGKESNSGGMAPTSALPAIELEPNPDCLLFDVTTYGDFVPLEIGVNNNREHESLTPGSMVGWHAQFGKRQRLGTFADSPLRLVESGQGGSRSELWLPGTPYLNKAVARFDAAIEIVHRDTGRPPKIFYMYTFGINDVIYGTPAATFKARELAFIAFMRARYGDFPIFFTELMNDPLIVAAGYPAIIEELVDEVGNAYLIPSANYPLLNSNHWDNDGYAMQVDWVVNKLLEIWAE